MSYQENLFLPPHVATVIGPGGVARFPLGVDHDLITKDGLLLNLGREAPNAETWQSDDISCCFFESSPSC